MITIGYVTPTTKSNVAGGEIQAIADRCVEYDMFKEYYIYIHQWVVTKKSALYSITRWS